MLAYCGMNCLECRAYKATVTADEEGPRLHPGGHAVRGRLLREVRGSYLRHRTRGPELCGL